MPRPVGASQVSLVSLFSKLLRFWVIDLSHKCQPSLMPKSIPNATQEQPTAAKYWHFGGLGWSVMRGPARRTSFEWSLWANSLIQQHAKSVSRAASSTPRVAKSAPRRSKSATRAAPEQPRAPQEQPRVVECAAFCSKLHDV